MYKRPYIPAKVYLWTSSTTKILYIFDSSDKLYEEDHIVIRENIYQDDTILNALNKISIYIKNTTDINIYGWVKKSPLMFSIKNKKWTGYDVNPFLSTNIKSEQLKEGVDYNYNFNELFQYSSINVAFSTDLPPTIHQYYFIKRQTMTVKQYNQRENQMKKLTMVDDLVEMLPEYYTRIQYHSNVSNIVLADIFDSTNVSKNIDMIQWVDDHSKILYKLSKQNKIKKEYLNSWTNIDKIDRIRVLNMYSIYNKNSYCKITIDESNIHISYILHSRQYIKYIDIQKHKKIIEGIVKNIIKQQLILKEVTINSALKINIQNASTKLLMNKLSKQIDIFNVINNADGDKKSIICTYKRTSNYTQNTDIYDYIRSRINLGISKSEIADELINLGVAGNVNQMINDEIDMINKVKEIDNKTFIKENGTIVIITPRQQGYNIAITNCPDIIQMRYLFFWLSKIMSTSIDKKVNEPKNVRKESVSESSPSQDSSISQASSISSYDSSGGAPERKNKKTTNYLITMLQQTDKDLFGEYYARAKCQSHVQPIVFTKEQKEILESKNKMHFDNVIEYGSSKDTMNYYACPKLWCPRSKIPLLQGEKCPNEDEEPIKMYKDIDKDKKSYVRLIKPNDKGMCVPCCGKNKQTDDKINACMKYLGTDNKNDKNEKVLINVNDENYLMNKVPIDTGRYGIIPEYVHYLLSSEPYKSCTGALNTKTYCYIKQGIDNIKHESVLYSLLELLNIKSKNVLRKKIMSSLDLITFITLSDGKICKEFMYIGEILPDNQAKLIKDFDIFNKNKKISNILYNEKNRSYILNIYLAYTRYIDYILSNDITIDKKGEYVIPLIHHLYNINIIVWENEDGNTYLNCNSTSFVENTLNSRFCMLIKEGTHYEAVVMKKRSTEATKIFKISDYPKIKKLVSGCDKISENIYNKLYTLTSWCKYTLENPDTLLISKIILNEDLSIDKVLTKKNVLLRFEKIGTFFLNKMISIFDLKTSDVIFFREVVGNVYNISTNKDDVSKTLTKISEMNISVHFGNVIYEKDKQIYTKLTIDDDTVISNGILLHRNDMNDYYKQINGINIQTKRWYELQKMIGKKIIKGHVRRDEALKHFKHIPEQDIVRIILEEMPIGREESKKWLSNVIIQTKYDYLSDYIKETKTSFTFSQNALVKNGERFFPTYLQVYHKSLPNEINNISEIVDNYDIDDKIDADILPSIFIGPYKKLSIKWNKNKKSKWSEMIYIENNYTIATMEEFINWLIKLLNIDSIKYKDIYQSSYKYFIDARDDIEAMNVLLHDTSYYNEWTKKSNRVYSTINMFLEKYYTKLSSIERAEKITEIFNSGDLYTNDLVLKVVSKILNISILIIQRGTYGDFGKDNVRGDINDLLTSSLLYTATDMKERPLIIFNKKCDKKRCCYYLVVEKTSPNSLYFNYEDVPIDIKDVINKHNE